MARHDPEQSATSNAPPRSGPVALRGSATARGSSPRPESATSLPADSFAWGTWLWDTPVIFHLMLVGAVWAVLSLCVGCEDEESASSTRTAAPVQSAAQVALVAPDPPEPKGPPPWADRWSPKTGFPCEVEEVLRMSCRRCHWDPQENDAPFGMVVYDDLLEKRSDKPIHQLMLAMVQAELMPPLDALVEPDVDPLTKEQRATLVGWLEQGAPRSEEVCQPPE